jgi:hypothetical protein
VASGLDVEWPRRALVGELRLDGPWMLLERDRSGALGLRGLLSAGDAAGAAPDGAGGRPGAGVPGPEAGGPALPVTTIRTLVVEGGGARVVDQRIEPPVAVDLARLSARLQGLSTDPSARPARVDLTARSANASVITVSGTVGSLGGPLRLEVDGELRDFAVPRANPYLVERVAWEARDGWLGTTARVRIDGDALDARATIRLSRLELARAGAHDEAQARMGLPLGMIVALMKDRRGEIRVTLPVGGKLSDPRFDLSEAIWQTVRNVAFKAITAPVSWIGRVRYGADARIERIDIDPVPFPPGGVALTAEAREQVGRVAAFLEQAPAVRLALTPVLSAEDRAALGRAKLETEVQRVAQEQQVSAGDALGRLFRQRLPRQPAPPTADELRAALEGTEPVVPAELATLASRRAAAVRDELRRAGVEAGRLREVVPTEVPAEDPHGQVSLDLLEPDSPGPPSRRVAGTEARPGQAPAEP